MQCVRQYGKDFYRLKRFLRCARRVRLVHSVQGCRADLVLAPPSHARAAAVRRQSSWSTSTGQSTARSVPRLRMMATLARSDHGGQSTWGGCTTRLTRERSMLTTEDEACVVRLRFASPSSSSSSLRGGSEAVKSPREEEYAFGEMSVGRVDGPLCRLPCFGVARYLCRQRASAFASRGSLPCSVAAPTRSASRAARDGANILLRLPGVRAARL